MSHRTPGLQYRARHVHARPGRLQVWHKAEGQEDWEEGGGGQDPEPDVQEGTGQLVPCCAHAPPR
eukprot:11955026-Alexandrium_andersonii.AAC.1